MNDATRRIGMAFVLLLGTSDLARAGLVITAKVDGPNSNGSTVLTGINNSGVAVGTYYTKGSGNHGLIYSGGSIQTVDAPGASDTFLTGINDNGAITGEFETGHLNTTLTGFVRSSTGAFTILTKPGTDDVRPAGINVSGTVVGRYYDTADRAFALSGGTYTLLPDHMTGGSVLPRAINNNGVIAGYYQTLQQSPLNHGFILNNGVYTNFSVFSSTDTYAFGIDTAGDTVGAFLDLNGRANGFYRTAGGQLSLADVPGATDTYLYGINDNSQVVGVYYDATGAHGFIGTPTAQEIPNGLDPTFVPEPATVVPAAIAGLFGLGYALRRRRAD